MRKKYRIFLMFGLCLAIGGMQASAEKPMDLAGAIGGSCNVIITEGDYVYTGEGMSVAAYRIVTDAGIISGLDRLDSLTMFGTVKALAARDGILYVAAGAGGLRVVDATDPRDLRLLEVWQTSHEVTAIARRENTLAIGWKAVDSEVEGGITFYSLQESGLLLFRGQLDRRCGVSGIILDQNLAYVAWSSQDSAMEMGAVDISDLTAPQLLDLAGPGLYPVKMALDGDLLYLLNDWNEVIVIETADFTPSEYTRHEFYIDSDYVAADFAVDGNRMYVIPEVFRKAWQYDISDFNAPELTAEIGLLDSPTSLAFQGDALFIGGEGGSLTVEDASQSGSLTQTCTTGTNGGRLSDLAIEDDRAYILYSLPVNSVKSANELYGPLASVGVYDIHEPEAPKQLSSFNLLASEVGSDFGIPWYEYGNTSLAVHGNFLCIAGRFSSGPSNPRGILCLMDVSNPDAPEALYTAENEFPYSDIALTDGFAYVSMSYEPGSSFQIFDFTIPSEPVLITGIGVCAASGSKKLKIENDTLYMSCQVANKYTYEIYAMDISNRLSPVQIGYYSAPSTEATQLGFLESFDVLNGFVYVLMDGYPLPYEDGVQIIDWRQSASPAELSWHQVNEPGGEPFDIVVENDRAYLATFTGVERVDISTPGQPAFVDKFPAEEVAQKVSVKDGIVYAVYENIGLQILNGHRFPVELAVQGSGTTDPPPSAFWQDDDVPLTITATPDPDWQFLRWEGGNLDDPTANPITISALSKTQLTAVFTESNHSLTLATAGQGTTNPAPGVYSYLHNAEALVTAVPLAGWAFDHWEGDYSGEPTANPISLVMDSDKTLTAVFMQAGHTLTMQYQGEGYATVAEGLHTYVHGSTISIMAIRESGWQFDHWEGDFGAAPKANPLTLTIDADKTLTAVFVQLQYTLNIAVEGNGQTSPAAGQYTYSAGTSATIAATPDDNWEFDHWGGNAGMNIYANPLTITMDAGKSVTAVFRSKDKPFWSCGGSEGDASSRGSDILVVVLSALALLGLGWRKRPTGV